MRDIAALRGALHPIGSGDGQAGQFASALSAIDRHIGRRDTFGGQHDPGRDRVGHHEIVHGAGPGVPVSGGEHQLIPRNDHVGFDQNVRFTAIFNDDPVEQLILTSNLTVLLMPPATVPRLTSIPLAEA